MISRTTDGREVMYEVVGSALSTACSIEHSLYIMFTSIIEPNNVEALSAAFFTVLSPNIKRDMVTAALHEYTDAKDIHKQWKSVCDEITSCLGKRAELAHFQLVVHMEEKDGNIIREILLEPDWFNVRAQQKNKGQRKKLTIAQVDSYNIDFFKTNNRIREFMTDNLDIQIAQLPKVP